MKKKEPDDVLPDDEDRSEQPKVFEFYREKADFSAVLEAIKAATNRGCKKRFDS